MVIFNDADGRPFFTLLPCTFASERKYERLQADQYRDILSINGEMFNPTQ